MGTNVTPPGDRASPRRSSFVGRLDSALTSEKLIAQGEAWVMGWMPPVLFVLFHRQPLDSDFEHFVQTQSKDIEEWPTHYQRCVLYHVIGTPSIGAAGRQSAADIVSRHSEKLHAITLGYAFCAQSGITRGVSKVVNWLAPPPYPAFSGAKVIEGLRKLQSVDSRVEPASLQGCYRKLVGRYLPSDLGADW